MRRGEELLKNQREFLDDFFPSLIMQIIIGPSLSLACCGLRSFKSLSGGLIEINLWPESGCERSSEGRQKKKDGIRRMTNDPSAFVCQRLFGAETVDTAEEIQALFT